MLRQFPHIAHPDLLVGIDTRDDAGVFRVREDMALVQTVDFFTPIVDDPYWYGAIAAANSFSDVYAMGGTPLTALNLVCFPIDHAPAEMLADILRGGYDKAQEAGVVIVGGHSVDDPEPKYGMAVTGIVHPQQVVTNAGAKPGDVLVLTKPLGSGIITTAAKFDECPPQVLAEAIRVMAMLNRGAAEAMQEVGVHAATDITGFGLIGHLHQMALASGVAFRLFSQKVPLLSEAERLAMLGNTTRGGSLNREYVGDSLQFADSVSLPMQHVLLDPQTSGGLVIAVAREREEALLEALRAHQTPCAAVVGEVLEGTPGLIVVE
ncbi:MAG: selenide, water dikinase [Armatimonadota bacterium]|nr:MAG: selenide, water dikinase [Armatimonadota bacterium]